MAFDANLILLDGSVDLDEAHDTPATTVARDANGAAVIDLKETGVKGLAAVLVMIDDADGAADTLTAFLEVSDAVDFASGINKLGSFGIAEATSGVIVGSEAPAIAILRFATDKRYVRLNATVGTTPDDFHTVMCLLSPYPFKTL